MSSIASFYLMHKDKFDEYCKMAHLVPSSLIPKQPASDKVFVRVVTRAEMKSPEFLKKQEYYKTVFDYLQKISKQPFEFHWSGYVMFDLLAVLKEERKIDLMEFSLRDTTEKYGSECWVFNKELKDKYLLQLNPSKFREDELKYWYVYNQ
ncbi:MAG TPA: hypothetical protein V6C81_19090 [Planktothrix sp.]